MCDKNVNISLTDFSLQSYLSQLSLPSKEDMTKIMADKLIEEMGIGHLLEDNPCQRSSSVYSPADDGWKNGKIILQKYLIILKVSLQKHNLVISVIFFNFFWYFLTNKNSCFYKDKNINMADGGMGDTINLHQNDILLFHPEDSYQMYRLTSTFYYR